MSSKVLPGGGVPRMEFRRVGAPLEPEPDPEPAADADLRQRLSALESEIPARERAALEQGLKQGYAKGFEAGKQTGERDGEHRGYLRAEDQMAQAAAHASETVQELLGTRRAMRRQMEEDLVRLAIEIARRILHRELHVDPAALLGIVRVAVDRLDAREIHRLRASVSDAPAVQARLHEMGVPGRLEIVPDATLPRGALVLETSRGEVDASIHTQLEEIERGFTDLVRRSA